TLVFLGGGAPRDGRRANDYVFSGGDSDTIKQKQTFNSAFGKISYDPTSRLRTGFSVLWTPTTSEGTLPAYNGTAPNAISSSSASNQIQKTRGSKTPQTNYAGTADFTLNSSTLLSFR